MRHIIDLEDLPTFVPIKHPREPFGSDLPTRPKPKGRRPWRL